MKDFDKKYYNLFIYSICVIIFVISIYNVIINVKHELFLNEKIIVNDIDENYKTFKNNILLIEDNLKKNKNNNKIYIAVSKALNILKQSNMYKLFPGDKLSYVDLYYLNNYFLDIINSSWIMNFNDVDDVNTVFNNEYVDILINNANYLNKELLNNSNFSYTFNNNIRDNINEEYQYILNNYKKFSYLILEISSKMENSYA